MDEPALGVLPVHADNDEDLIRAIPVLLEVAEEVRVVGVGEEDVEGALQGGVVVADGIDAGDLSLEVALLISVPLLELVFFAVLILFFAGEWFEVHQLVSAAVDADV